MNKSVVGKLCKEYLEIEATLEALKARKEVIKSKLLDGLNEENIPSKYDIKTKEVAPTTIFDSAKFRKEYGALYNEFRTKEKAGYKTLTIIEL